MKFQAKLEKAREAGLSTIEIMEAFFMLADNEGKMVCDIETDDVDRKAYQRNLRYYKILSNLGTQTQAGLGLFESTQTERDTASGMRKANTIKLSTKGRALLRTLNEGSAAPMKKRGVKKSMKRAAA